MAQNGLPRDCRATFRAWAAVTVGGSRFWICHMSSGARSIVCAAGTRGQQVAPVGAEAAARRPSADRRRPRSGPRSAGTAGRRECGAGRRSGPPGWPRPATGHRRSQPGRGLRPGNHAARPAPPGRPPARWAAHRPRAAAVARSPGPRAAGPGSGPPPRAARRRAGPTARRTTDRSRWRTARCAAGDGWRPRPLRGQPATVWTCPRLPLLARPAPRAPPGRSRRTRTPAATRRSAPDRRPPQPHTHPITDGRLAQVRNLRGQAARRARMRRMSAIGNVHAEALNEPRSAALWRLGAGGLSPQVAGQPGPLPLARWRTVAGRCPWRRRPAPPPQHGPRRNAPSVMHSASWSGWSSRARQACYLAKDRSSRTGTPRIGRVGPSSVKGGPVGMHRLGQAAWPA